ncbi:hypothetical protein AIOGIFDO_01499 [Candidatus Methanoperedenaceae archaeon GB37]|nr:hypothetical protein AIOGIFDO_01499 [Candidatus Methanoperedenaceae archaeon GB37]
MNLDLEATRTSQEIITKTGGNRSSEVENLITKTLGVLQENGIYACTLYLNSRTSEAEKKIGPVIHEELLKMTKRLVKTPIKNDDYEYLTDEICSDIDLLILTKQLWEQTLTYARYGAKART